MFDKPSAWARGGAIGRRGLLKHGAIAGLGLVLAACAPSSPSTPAVVKGATATINQTSASVTIPTPTIPSASSPSATAVPPTPTPVPRVVTLWTADSSSTLVKALESIGRTFSTQKPNLAVKVVGGQTDYGKIIQSLALTIGPDLIDPGALAPYATRGVFRALDGFIAAGDIKASNYQSVMWASGQWQGKVYGIPALDHGPELGLLVNTALVGGNSPNISSWDKLFPFGTSATKKAGQGLSILGWDPLNGSGGLLETVASLTGQAWFDPSTNKVSLNNPAYQAYLDHVRGYYQSLGIQAMDNFRSQSPPAFVTGDSGLDRGKEVAVIGGYRLASTLSDDSKVNFAASWLPSTSGTKVQRLGGRFLAIPTVAKQPDDSWQFLSYLAGDAANNLLFAEAGCCAWSNSFVDSQSWQKRSLLGFYANSITQSTGLVGQPINPIAGYAQNQWQTAVGAVIQNNTSPADALKAAQSATEAELQRLAKA